MARYKINVPDETEWLYVEADWPEVNDHNVLSFTKKVGSVFEQVAAFRHWTYYVKTGSDA